MVNIEKNTDKNNLENNQSSILKTQGNDKLDISNDYMIINNNSNIKEIKKSKKINNENNFSKIGHLSGNKNIYGKNYYNTIGNEVSNDNNKIKINHHNNSTGKRKHIKKHEKGFNSII